MSKNIIFIDGWFLQPPLRGIGIYLKNILIYMPKEFKDLEFVLLIPNLNLDLSIFPKNLKVKLIKCNYLFLWYELYLPLLARKTKNSTIFYPSGICGIFTFYKKFNVISTIHDVASLLPLKYNPITFQARHILGRIYRKLSFYKLLTHSKFIFTVSNTAKYDIEKVCLKQNLLYPKIYVVNNASEIKEFPKHKKNKSFLCITGEHKQKNYRCIINALNFLNNNSLKGWKIYLVGLKENAIINHKCGAKIIKKTYMESSEISVLFAYTYCLIFPSIYESFGIPLLDALRSKCYIIASKNGASKEVCDDSALFFNPYSPEELSEKILEIINYYPKKPFIKKTNILKQTWKKSSNYIFKTIQEHSNIT